MQFKLTKKEKSWILYDVGNSAFVLMVSTILPVYFNYLAQNADGDFLWCSIYGSQHLYRKCSELYGEVHFG